MLTKTNLIDTIMKIATKLSIIALMLTFAAAPAYSQDLPDEGTVGIRASFQGSQSNLAFPIWASERVSIAPVVGLSYVEDQSTTVNFGLKPRFYQSLGNNFASYLGLAGLVQYTSPDVGDNETDFLVGVNGGGEYFLDEHFSIGVEGRLNFIIADQGSNGLQTGAAVSASYYF